MKNELAKRIAALSPEQQALLKLQLQKQGIDLPKQSTIPPRQQANLLPLSFAQQRLWFLNQLEPDNPFYNISGASYLTGSLNLAVLRRSFDALVQRHESLRTTFVTVNREPRQAIAPTLNYTLPVIDLQAVPTAQQQGWVQQLATEEARRPFNLAQGPLLRLILLKLQPDKHVLFLTIHHTIADGWSRGILLRELAICYQALSTGQPIPLPQLAIQYGDFAVWQRQWLQGKELQIQLSYWQRQLADLPTLQLPSDRPRLAAQSYQGANQSQTLPRSLTKTLKATAQQEGITLSTLLLTVFKIFLHRYTGQVDLVVGSPVANRNRPEIEGLIGFFVNTLVLRSDLSGNPTSRELLKRVHQVTLGAYSHQDLPFERLVEELQPERDLGYNPLFQVVFHFQDASFQLQNSAMPDLKLPDLQLRNSLNDLGAAPFDISLNIEEVGDDLDVGLEYTTDLFDSATIASMLSHFQMLATNMVADLDQPIDQLPLITSAESQQLTTLWNQTQAAYGGAHCIHHLFDQQATRTPDAIAIASTHQQITYRTLHQRAHQLAQHLQQLGVLPETLVGVYMERSIEMVVGLLAILKAGGAYIPLDPTYPTERLSFILKDSQASVLLTQPTLVDSLPEHTAPVVCLDANGRWEAQIANSEFRIPNSELPPSSLAYTIYTSGSTGIPKGVAITHQSAVTLIHWATHFFAPAALAEVLASTSICFDLSIFELFVPLSCGGKVVLAENALHLPTLPTAHNVTLVNTVPSAIAQLLNLKSIPASVCAINLAGEALANELVQRLYQCPTIQQVFNLYGPSEDTTYTTAALIPPDNGQIPTIGGPIANTQVYILDRHLQPVPMGVPGELYISGEGLARGYRNRPALTAEKFIPNPFGQPIEGDREEQIQIPYSRLYKTGDLARYRADGQIHFLGRRDDQVKIRGFRIELGEIGAVLDSLPAIREAATLAQIDEIGDQYLVAYVVLKPEATIGVKDLRAFLSERLPAFMVPTTFVLLEALPRTLNGKLDRRSLLRSTQVQPEVTTNFVAPRTLTEELLADLWGKALEHQQIGIYDNFFDQGGHSLLAIRLASQISQTLKVELSVLRLFKYPTIATLANHIEVLRQEQQGLTANPIEPIARQGELPFSITQHRLWYYNLQANPDHYFYHTVTSLRVRGSLDILALERSLNQIIQRHEVLRTRVVVVNDRPLKSITPYQPLKLLLIDLQALSARQREVEAQRLAVQEFQRPFELDQGSLLRVTLIQLDRAKYVVQMTVHQLAFDAWSRNVLMQELQILYNAFSRGQPNPLSELPIQFDDFAYWQQQWIREKGLQASLAYWQEQLAGELPVLQLPTDHPRPAVKTFQGETVGLFLPRNLTDALRALSQQEEVTLFMTLFAAYTVWLYCYTQQEDMIVATSAADRIRPEVENLIGSFNNYLMLRSDLSGDPTFRDLLQRVRQVALDAYTHQEMSFTELLEALKPELDLSRTPLFQTMFTYKRFLDMPTQEFQGLTLSPYSIDWSTARCDVTLSLLDDGQDIRGFLEYSTDLFAAETIAQWLRHAQIIIESLVADPNQHLSELRRLVEPEPQIETLADLNAGQQKHLEILISRHTQQTRGSKQLAQTYRPVLADNRATIGFSLPLKEVVYPLVGQRSSGSRLWDVDGRDYIDLTMSFGITLFGHHPDWLKAALQAQLEQGIQLGPQSVLAGEVAQLICEFTGLERVTFCGTRTEAVIMALRLARATTGRHKIALFAGSYHGNADGTLAVAADATYEQQSMPFNIGITPNSVADVLVLDYGNPHSLAAIEAYEDELAAVLVEPVQSQLSDRLDLQPKAFLQQLRSLTQAIGTALIFDETVFGFRIHPGGSQAWFDVKADLAVYGKPVGGGMPIGIVAGKAMYMDKVDGGLWHYGDTSKPQSETTEFASTYSNHPLSMAAALAILKQLKAEGPTLQQQLNQRTTEFVNRLNAEFISNQMPLRLKHFGSRFGITTFGSLGTTESTRALIAMNLLRYHLADRHVYLRGSCGSLSTAHTDADINHIIQAFKDSVVDMRRGGFI